MTSNPSWLIKIYSIKELGTSTAKKSLAGYDDLL